MCVSVCIEGSLVAQTLKNLPAMWEIWAQSLGWQDPLDKGMVIHSSILAWRIPWTEPGKLQSMGLQKVRYHWVTNTFTSLSLHIYVFHVYIHRTHKYTYYTHTHTHTPVNVKKFPWQVKGFNFKMLHLELCMPFLKVAGEWCLIPANITTASKIISTQKGTVL